MRRRALLAAACALAFATGLAAQPIPPIGTRPIGTRGPISQQRASINVADYNAKADGRIATDGVAIASNTSFTSATGNFTFLDAGKTIIIFGAGNSAHTANWFTTVTYVNSTTVTLAAAPAASLNPATFIIGTLDHVNIQAAINAAHVTVSQFYPTTGNYIGTEASIEFPTGIYLISQPLVVANSPYILLSSHGNATIVQVDSTKDILQLTAAYRPRISNLALVGGKRAILYQNQNVDGTKLTVEDSTIQATSDYAIFVNASQSMPGTGIPYSTGTITTTLGSNTVAGSGTAWVDANHAYQELHLIVADKYYRIASVTNGTTLVTSRPIEVSGSGLAYEIGDYHSSALVDVNHTHFLNPAKVLYSDNEQTSFNDDWVELFGNPNATSPYPLFKAHTAAFRTMYGNLIINRMVGVPVMCDASNCAATVIRAPRWIDTDGGNIVASQNRFGGEAAGMMIVKSFCPFQDVSPWQKGCKVILENNWQLYGGLAAANAADVGVLGMYANGLAAIARENVIQQFIVHGNAGTNAVPIVNNEAMADGGNVVENSSALDTATFFGAVPVSLERKFRWEIGPNDTGTDTVYLDGTWNGATRAIGFSRITRPLKLTASITSPNLAAGACANQSVPWTGIRDGDPIIVGVPNAIGLLGYAITATPAPGGDSLNILFCNPQSGPITGATATFKFMASKINWFVD